MKIDEDLLLECEKPPKKEVLIQEFWRIICKEIPYLKKQTESEKNAE